MAIFSVNLIETVESMVVLSIVPYSNGSPVDESYDEDAFFGGVIIMFIVYVEK